MYIFEESTRRCAIDRKGRGRKEVVTDLIRQVSQLLRAELKELVDVARATIEPIEPCDEEW